MATNDFLPFATAGGANVLTPAEWLALASRPTGWSAGVAKSEELNTAWRQALTMSTLIGRFIAELGSLDALDNGDIDALLNNFIATYRAQKPNFVASVGGTANALSITLSPPPANLAALTGVPLYVTIASTNTGPATLTVNGLTAPIANANKGALIAGDLPAGVILPVMFDGASFCLVGFSRGRLINVRSFQGGGIYTYTPSPGTDYVEVEVMAAGGGGAGVPATAAGETAAGGPGGSGGWAYKLIRSGFAGVPVTVGVGGIGGDGAVGFNAGGNGGASSFGAHVSANGGGGGISAGQTGTFDGYYALGGVAATLGPSGDIRAPGLDGAATLVINKSGVPVGRTPSRYAGGQGSGGSGQTSSQSTAAKTGNLGADGMVIVREYA